jgi:hypothetical protein
MSRMRTMTGGHRLVVPGTGTGRVGEARRLTRTISSGDTTVCTITRASGGGTCTLTPTAVMKMSEIAAGLITDQEGATAETPPAGA